ncbi:hypothetical protein ABIF07_001076 [Bradyrhizobium elkanii]|uniref:hypothetical protein n=1 Tax=Bradyrhizobium elkanii TaxID=29448 RepID=UPI002169445C|nr:hypothetical protein [Bradyrhizobium elkanii]MCS3692008.1 hypothetical protein [Bradyrhizobium elkanii]
MANFFDQFDSASAPAASPYAGAISSIESGGNYRAIGPDTGSMGRALGKYQVMSANVGPWSKEVLGREITPREFINNPDLQDAIFNGKFGQYVDKYGPEGAAKAWFAGERGMNNPNAKDAFGTTVAEYARRFNKARGSDQDAVSAVEQFAPDAPQVMAFADDKGSKASTIQPGAKNFFDQFDEPAAAPASATEGLPAVGPSGLRRVYIGPDNAKPPQADQPANADRGTVDALARGVAQGFTANFGDEIRGLVEASGANPDDPASVYKLLSGALKYWSGDAEAKKRYDAAVARERELNKVAEEQHPVASTVGNIGGAVILPVGAGAGAATLGGRVLAGAGTGAVLGGAAGAGEGQGAIDSASRALVGAGIGGALGGAAPVAIEGVVRGARAIAQPVANTVRGIRDVDSEAARRVVTALQRDQAIDPQAASRLTPNEFAASVQSGGPAVIGDLGGETTRALARSAANTSPEGRAVLNRAINERYEGQSGRVVDWLRRTFHYPDAAAQADAIDQVQRTVNRTNYQRAMQQGDRPIMSPELDRLMGSPAVVEAMRRASISGRDRAITQGYGAMRQGVTVENGVVTFTRGPNGVPTYPNLAFWDATKRELDDAARRAGGGTHEAGVLNDLARTLRTELDRQVPSYQTARAGAARFFDAENALEAGQNFVGKNMTAGDARRALAQMTPQERQLFQDGFVSRFIETLNQVGDRRNILNQIAASPAAREKLNVALGPGRAAELEAGLRVEGIMDLARNAVQGNSTTARQLAELGLAGGAYGFSGGGLNPFTDPGAVVNAAIVYGAARGRNAINERLARRVAEMLVSNDPRTITRGIQTVARNQTLFNSLRSADRGLARVGAEQSPSVPVISGAIPARADENNPK